MALIAGIEAGFSQRGIALLLQMVSSVDQEIETHRRWWAERRVDGVLVVDVQVDDPRVPALEELGLPAVVVGERGYAGSLPVAWNDDRSSMTEAVRYLTALGHRRLAHVSGPARLVHTALRRDAFIAAIESTGGEGVSLPSDYTADDGARATRQLLVDGERPTAIIYDNDVMALAGLTVVQELGLGVPTDVSIVAWDDSILCRLVNPPLTALSRDIAAHGTLAAELLITRLMTGHAEDAPVPPARLIPRRSTAPRHGD